jgi:Periplasmic copper-binding protein (NosD)/Right handed beta helix region
VVTLGQRQPGAAPGTWLVDFFDRTGETMMNTKRAITALALCGGLMAVLPGRAAAQQPQCGDVITEDTTLEADLNCQDYFDLEGDPVLTIGAHNVVLDLGGHRVIGPSEIVAEVGNPGYDNVTIRNGSIAGNADNAIRLSDGAEGNRIVDLEIDGNVRGIFLTDSPNNVIRRVDARGSDAGLFLVRSNNNRTSDSVLTGFDWGARLAASNENQFARVRADSSFESVLVEDSNSNRFTDSELLGEGALVRGSFNVLARNTIGGDVGICGCLPAVALVGSENTVAENRIRPIRADGPAVRVESGDGNALRRNHVGVAGAPSASLLNDGVFVAAAATGTLVAETLVEDFQDDGIDVESPSTTLRRNSANDNGDHGIEAVPGVRGQGNMASGNGNPLQCLNLVCG